MPEKTRTTLTRPTYGSLDVFTISATSGPAGSQATVPAALPDGRYTSGGGCSCGAGNPATTRSSSSAHPTPVVAHAGTTGWNAPVDIAFSRSATRVSSLICSPAR